MDCSTSQLRDYSIAFFSHLNAKVMELQRQLAQDHGQFAVLNTEVDKTLGKLKIFEEKVSGEVMEGKVQTQAAMGKASDVETDMKELKSRVEGVISDLNRHIGGSFSAAEEEFRKLQQHLQAAGTFAAASHEDHGGRTEDRGEWPHRRIGTRRLPLQARRRAQAGVGRDLHEAQLVEHSRAGRAPGCSGTGYPCIDAAG